MAAGSSAQYNNPETGIHKTLLCTSRAEMRNTMTMRSLRLLNRRTAFSTLGGTARHRANWTNDRVAISYYRAITPFNCARFDLHTLRHAGIRETLPSFVITSSIACPAFPYPANMKFDKVPNKLPEWWDDEEDEDDEAMKRKLAKEGGGSGNFGNGGDGGGGYGSNGAGGGDGHGDGDGGKDGFLPGLLAMYVRTVQKHPVRTKAISTCVLGILGDILAQRIAHRQNVQFTLDLRRTLSIGLWGLVALGPALHYWYAALDRLFFRKYAVLYKVLADQLVFSTVSNASFMAGVGTLEGHPLKESIENVRSKLWPSMKANWMLWPAAQVINFACIPRSFQVVYVNCIALVWCVILAYIAHE